MTSFFADLGYNPALPIDLDVRASQTAESKSATTFLLHMKQMLRELQAKIRSSAEKMKMQYNRGRRDQTFRIGDMVLVSTKNLGVENTGAKRRKLAPKWIGPYEVIENVQGSSSYRLNLPRQSYLYPVFHTLSLKLFQKDTSSTRDNAVPTVRLKDGTEGHLIEDILEHRFGVDCLDEYKCKWVGAVDDITWEPATNLQSVPELIKQFLRKENGLNPRGSTRLRNKHHSANYIGETSFGRQARSSKIPELNLTISPHCAFQIQHPKFSSEEVGLPNC
ncbi:unnamed protein product [Phytophthora fragariaefolia]|uniref:Unnamed protein product n=1 Tax=Phytophthora fragariaefolia TaxID=1490495 RepID=A0A9W6YCT7_9STRA|nr:unnamed protein product [Phytophthora fragariaefolia]